jgi:hypothetical protein
MMRHTSQRDLTPVIDQDFDLADAEQVHGVTADDSNDCDHKAQIGENGLVSCTFCGRPLER